ncbi:hypothetical protein FIBSPDRAFT_110741 [Athelia psychrophila]|uniref:Uncharacterized protein n=1 Tax=Athelia psychrophila TaxID=1759441 RepID=A0A166TEF5_9AGAM|nr:hypothetical protein FIBSPDRAFT_110741 [Fibularhizoctonia sp. CBS 109695]
MRTQVAGFWVEGPILCGRRFENNCKYHVRYYIYWARGSGLQVRPMPMRNGLSMGVGTLTTNHSATHFNCRHDQPGAFHCGYGQRCLIWCACGARQIIAFHGHFL